MSAQDERRQRAREEMKYHMAQDQIRQGKIPNTRQIDSYVNKRADLVDAKRDRK